MDSDEGKLFIGGIGWDTTEDTLREYFGKYGQVTEAVVMVDKLTHRPRGFGFVVFADPSVLHAVLQDTHFIDGRTVEAKRALSREEQQTSRSGNPNSGRNSGGGGGNNRTKKIFVGGLPSTLTEDEFRHYFEAYGDVIDVVIMFDQNTNRPRGFGFISFDTEDAVDKVLQKTYHELNNKLVEVKRALPKDAHQSGSGGGSGRGRSGGYQGYGSSGANASGFDGGSRYMQQQSTGGGGGYPPFSNYGPPSYGYLAANSNIGYGGYGVGGFGSAYGGPAGAYGNPNGPNMGYSSVPVSVMKSTWGSQAAYGTSGYGVAAGYGANVPWNAQAGGAASVGIGQSLGYGNQGYGFGYYSGNDGGYGSGGGSFGNAPNSNAGSEGEHGAGGGYSTYRSNGSSGY